MSSEWDTGISQQMSTRHKTHDKHVDINPFIVTGGVFPYCLHTARLALPPQPLIGQNFRLETRRFRVPDPRTQGSRQRTTTTQLHNTGNKHKHTIRDQISPWTPPLLCGPRTSGLTGTRLWLPGNSVTSIYCPENLRLRLIKVKI